MDEEVCVSSFETIVISNALYRLLGCKPDVDVWQRVLHVRALVTSPEEESVIWIKFANLCRKSNRMTLAEKTINSLLTPKRVRNSIVDRLTYISYSHRDSTMTEAPISPRRMSCTPNSSICGPPVQRKKVSAFYESLSPFCYTNCDRTSAMRKQRRLRSRVIFPGCSLGVHSKSANGRWRCTRIGARQVISKDS